MLKEKEQALSLSSTGKNVPTAHYATRLPLAAQAEEGASSRAGIRAPASCYAGRSRAHLPCPVAVAAGDLNRD